MKICERIGYGLQKLRCHVDGLDGGVTAAATADAGSSDAAVSDTLTLTCTFERCGD